MRTAACRGPSLNVSPFNEWPGSSLARQLFPLSPHLRRTGKTKVAKKGKSGEEFHAARKTLHACGSVKCSRIPALTEFRSQERLTTSDREPRRLVLQIVRLLLAVLTHCVRLLIDCFLIHFDGVRSVLGVFASSFRLVLHGVSLIFESFFTNLFLLGVTGAKGKCEEAETEEQCRCFHSW